MAKEKARNDSERLERAEEYLAAAREHCATLGKFRPRVESIIENALPGAFAELDIIPQIEKLSGHVIWQGFDGMSDIERQRKLWRTLREGLLPTETYSLSLILTLTPAELNAIKSTD